MPTQTWIVMTQSERDAATNLDGYSVMLGARLIDNPLADGLGLGKLIGRWVAPARLLYDLDYRRWVAVLGALSIIVIESETLFISSE
ncbi:hypothetical protein [Rhizobium sp.]